jgi:hypothetical protein
MNVIFTELAAKELMDAQSLYEIEIQGLGNAFLIEMKKAIQRISNFPEAWPVLANEIRKCVVRKFPYNLVYSIEKDFILILAVAHQHRKPFYWIEKSETIK